MRFAPLRLFDGLATRVAGTLALALLPIGAIAVLQAFEISREDARSAEVALMNATAEAATGEALAVASAAGTSGTLAAHMSGLGGDHPGCSQIFANVIALKRQYSFAGFIDETGVVRCGSANVGQDLSNGVVHPRMAVEQEQIVTANLRGPISHTSVIVVATPVFEGERYVGYVSVSVPHRRIPELVHHVGDDAVETDLVTFNSTGQPLSSSVGFEEIDSILPEGTALELLATQYQTTFEAKSRTGEARIFSVVSIIPGVLYALGSHPYHAVAWPVLSAVLFPLLMLVAGLIVAFQAVNRLVIRNVRGLIRNMGEFSRTRRIQTLPGTRMLSREIRDVEAAWTDLASHVLREEAELENIVHEKNVLLKEVHHRVKNNLQLIASIVSLKIRRATSPEARRTLKEVQMRVRSIASVHQSLYSNPTTGQVNADEILTNVLDGIIEGGGVSDRKVDITRHYDRVLLYPDQAVPFLLLASEAVTNALKYMGTRPDGTAWMRITLEAVADDRAELEVVNTCGAPLFPPDQVRGSGLGRSLMTGFAAQLDGRVTVEETDALYRFHLTFAPASFDPEGRDASVPDDTDDAPDPDA